MYIIDIIDKKRKGEVLSKEEIEFAVNGYVKGSVLDEQMSALLMAIMLNGMNIKETYYLTKVMQNSGKTYSFPFEVADKHSSGGVSDSTTLILLPTLSAMNVKVAKMSGKSLGYTGGTIDKVSMFKNFNTELDEADFKKALNEVGGALISQSDEIALADKKIYALRDRCACVESVPLIASSIMSKKLASGSNTILLDVKCGSGAFMKDKRSAIKLAKTMVKIGKMDGKNIRAIVTNMNTPLSSGIGCAQEVYCVIKALNKEDSDLLELSKILSAHLYSMTMICSYENAYNEVCRTINSGKAKHKLEQIVKNQGGDASAILHPEKLLDAKFVTPVKCADNGGYVSKIDALTMAKVQKYVQNLAPEKDKHSCGVMLNVKVGSGVKQGDELAKIYSASKLDEDILQLFLSGIKFSATPVKKEKLVLKIIK